MVRIIENIQDAPAFLLGMGCQKGGTTWLYHYLSRHPSADMGFAKEYHVFDALYTPVCRSAYENVRKEAKALLDDGEIKKKRGVIKRLEFLSDIESYYEYFEYLYLKGKGNIQLVGDITPSYSSLSLEVLSGIRRKLEARQFKPKVVFLMRDPVERCWSQVRMDRRNELRKNPNTTFKESEEEHLMRRHKGKPAQVRTRYDLTLENIKRVFKPDEFYTSFYETFFSEREVKRLTQFLGIKYLEPNFKAKKNVTLKNNDISECLKREVALYYSKVYEYAFDSYGEDFIRSIWSSAKYLD